MKPWHRWILILSLCANLALLIAFFAAPAPKPIDAPAWEPEETVLQEPSPASVPETIASAQPRTGWQQVEADDYTAYIDNLRQIGCPELTIRDIVTAEINDRFEPAFLDLLRRADVFEYWRVGPEDPETAGELERQLEDLEAERIAVLRRFLGEDFTVRKPLYWRTLPELANQAGYTMLPESLRTTLPGMNQADRMRTLQESLSPEDLFEYEVRHHPMADFLRHRLAGIEVSEEEFRQLFQVQRSFNNPSVASEPDATDSPSALGNLMDEVMNFEQQKRDAFREVLGDDRYRDMTRSRDPNWQRLKQVADSHALDQETVESTWRLQQEFQSHLVETLGDQTLTDEERDALMAISMAHWQEQAQALLGEDAANELGTMMPGGPGMSFEFGSGSGQLLFLDPAGTATATVIPMEGDVFPTITIRSTSIGEGSPDP